MTLVISGSFLSLDDCHSLPTDQSDSCIFPTNKFFPLSKIRMQTYLPPQTHPLIINQGLLQWKCQKGPSWLLSSYLFITSLPLIISTILILCLSLSLSLNLSNRVPYKCSIVFSYIGSTVGNIPNPDTSSKIQVSYYFLHEDFFINQKSMIAKW